MKTKYPIILVHGIVLKDWSFFKAFGRIEKVLKEEGYTVYTSNTDGFGTIKNNALQLKKQIYEILEKEHVDKVNLIAHSKGGLDSKYMIKELKMEDYVASLTTLCTPHQGSIVATKLLDMPNFLKKIIAFWINFWYKIFGDKKPDSLRVCMELKKTTKIEIDSIITDSKVYCQSYSSRLDKAKDDFIMSIPLIFSRYYEKDASDGLVSCESSIFGNYLGDCLDESISHSEIVDFMVKKKKKEKIYHFYKELCLNLSKKGF